MQAMLGQFRELIRLLMQNVGYGQTRPNTDKPLLAYIYMYLQRTRIRLENLVERWKQGKLPKPRKSRAGQTQAERKTPRFRLPTQFGWLHKQTEIVPFDRNAPAFGTGHVALQMAELINGPEMAQLLAEAPQVARFLRPLRHMLGISTVPAAVGPFIPQPPPPPPPPPPGPTIRIDLGGGHYEIRPANSTYKPRIRWGIREV
jgi:hypothetical protein